MKKKILLISFLFGSIFCHAQRFFYVEPNKLTSRAISEVLEKESQYVADSQMTSDYIIRSDVFYESLSNTFSMRVTMQDSLSLHKVIEVSEQYSLRKVNEHSRTYLSFLLSSFIDKSISLMLATANQDHIMGRTKYMF